MLIFQNGTAYFQNPKHNRDIGCDGMPISCEGEEISVPCYIEMLSDDRNGRNDEGRYPRQSFTISFDYDSVGDDFNPSEVRVVHSHKGDLGSLTIQRIEHYDLTRTIQVWAQS